MGMVKPDVLDLSFSKVPMLKPLLALIVGIILGKYFELFYVSYFPYIILMSFLVLVISQISSIKLYRKALFTYSYYLMVFLLGIWSISIHKPSIKSNHFSKFNASQLVGIIDDEPIYKEKSIRFPIRIIAGVDSQSSYPMEGKLMVTLMKDSLVNQELRYGEKIVFQNNVTATAGSLNPKEFDYSRYLENKGIWHQSFWTTTSYKVIGEGFGNSVLDYSLKIRLQLIEKFAKYIHDPEAYQIAIALIFGYRSQVELSTLDAFTNTGTIHVLSVSGLHVSLVFGLLTFVLIGFDRFRYGKIIRCSFIFMAVWAYVVLTGMSPPIMRAGIMISFFIISTVSGRRQIAMNTLLASALFILLLAPQYLFDVGFQLSYAAILGIILLYPILKSFWLPDNKWLSLIVEYCYVSIAAQLFTLPLALYYFGQFPIYFLFANLFIAIPSTIVMYLGIALALTPIDILDAFLGKLLDWTLIFSVEGLKYIARLPMAVSKGILWDGCQALGLSVVLWIALIALNYKNKKALFAAVILFFALCVYTTIRRIQYDNYEGSRIYSLRSDLAIANIDEGKVTLFTTCDSINHSTVKFSILPDLIRYSNEEDIEFVHLQNDKRNNYELQTKDKDFLIVEDLYNIDDNRSYDFVIWRKNNRNDLSKFMSQNPKTMVIIDGSNSQKTIDKLGDDVMNNKGIYVLKNNFAYVWDRD